ncbi:hypothetical protein [Anaeromassilibacillus senegalensis]|uniref:hypothetical protein n=1 Tax=Anaeromassilibacillus senegalensis TaxID=1673717 RepID=UPI0012B56C8E|nr:hypothetical protein [Anaeromassilibacillus senegalensis]
MGTSDMVLYEAGCCLWGFSFSPAFAGGCVALKSDSKDCFTLYKVKQILSKQSFCIAKSMGFFVFAKQAKCL